VGFHGRRPRRSQKTVQSSEIVTSTRNSTEERGWQRSFNTPDRRPKIKGAVPLHKGPASTKLTKQGGGQGPSPSSTTTVLKQAFTSCHGVPERGRTRPVEKKTAQKHKKTECPRPGGRIEQKALNSPPSHQLGGKKQANKGQPPSTARSGTQGPNPPREKKRSKRRYRKKTAAVAPTGKRKAPGRHRRHHRAGSGACRPIRKRTKAN